MKWLCYQMNQNSFIENGFPILIVQQYQLNPPNSVFPFSYGYHFFLNATIVKVSCEKNNLLYTVFFDTEAFILMYLLTKNWANKNK